jgi:hypothetical protein
MVSVSITPVKSTGVYDPWIDVNHDGKVKRALRSMQTR